MKKRMIYLAQLFEVEAGTITTGDLDPAISIDHNQRLVAGIQSLMTVLGITELTPMSAGTQVKQYKYEQVSNPDQVGEGEVIGLTKYERRLVNTFELILNKFRKQTTAEAIQRVGRSKAVNDTDTLLMRSIQKGVKTDFFAFIRAGVGAVTNLGNSGGLQGALAALWGEMSVYYQDMDVTPIYFVNPLDIATYLANATITTQTAFGFQYIENFLGLGTVVIDASVTQGTVQGTVKENLNGVYVPANGDVGQSFGLTSDSTGLVGMKHFLKNDTACVNTLMMTGVTFYAEDASGIFTCAISGSLGSLTVSSSAGTETGDTKITVTETKGAGNVYKYKVADAAVDVTYMQGVQNWSAWDGSADITAATGKKITIVEADSNYKALKVGSATVTANS